jgi:hypothetical protein
MAGKDLGNLTAELVRGNMSDGLNRWENSLVIFPFEQLRHSESHNSSAIFLIVSRAEDLEGSNLGRLSRLSPGS